MKKRSTTFIYFKIFLVSSISGFACFLLVSFFFARTFSLEILLSSAILGPVIGNMIGFSCALIGDPISRKLESIPRPLNTISQAFVYFVVALTAATLFFMLMSVFGIFSGLSTKLLITFLLIAGGVGVVVTLVMTVYEHLKTELEKSYEKLRENELLERDLQVARQVQAGLLPSGDIKIDGFEVSTYLKSAKKVGGDYFDFIPLKKNMGIVIADVSGKGIPASLVMSNLHATLHALAGDRSLVDLFDRLNQSILYNTTPKIFVTFFYGILNTLTGKLQYINAGHNPPLLVRHDGTVDELSRRGVGLGLTTETNFTPGSVIIHPQDTLVLYTDGLTEAGIPYVEPWGERNLEIYLSTIFREPPDRMVELILDKVTESVKGVPQTDDIALVLLKRTKV